MRLPPFTLERYFSQHEFSVELNLSASDCESLTIRELLALDPGAEERLLGLRLGYTETQGSPSLRSQISGLYSSTGPEGILVHTGAEEGILLFMSAMLDRGDHLIVHWPCYQSLHEIARGIGCRLTQWNAREEEGWALDPRELERHIRHDTRAIVINVPHNPTGYHMPREAFQEVVKIADKHGVILFSDEVYRGLEYRPDERLPAACDASERAVSLGVVSKTYGLPGLRIGWIATRNAEVLSRLQAMKDYTTICSAAPSELLAELALRHEDELASRSRTIIGDNLAVLTAFFAKHAGRFAWQSPKAGPIAFPRLIGGDSGNFCTTLAKKSGVLLLPGSVYDDSGNHFRIGFGRRNMPEAVARLDAFLQRGTVVA
ncbi:MAG: aminotransferase class I/II-fold pyridoxal phosphate-dependent enzyme [Spirochaetia bacterium]|jgi:aspartate/methionine/tyrosine aminotransferase